MTEAVAEIPAYTAGTWSIDKADPHITLDVQASLDA